MLKGKVILITGASRGIGAATAKLVGSLGASVGVNYAHNSEAADHVVRSILEGGGKAIAVQADVTDPQQVDRMVTQMAKELGPIDSLVSNASIHFKVLPFTAYAWPDFEQKLTGELKAAFNCAQAVVPGMIERGSGNLVFVSSVLSRHSQTGFCAHSTAKSGLDAFARTLEIELGVYGIRVNVVAPGLTLTDATTWIPEEQKLVAASFTPLRRLANPNDIAGAIAWMCSNHAGFITGNYISVDGGAYQH